MHPAPSLILFTTLSGIGLGGLAWALLALAIAPTPDSFWPAAGAWALSAAGLSLSVGHLQNRKNAWRAFTQPGSSWLSREAWLAVLSLGSAAVLAYAVGHAALPPLVLAVPIALALATVLATAMIYAQLKTVPRWHTRWTPFLFLVLALAGGAMLVGRATDAALLLLPAGAALLAHWTGGDMRVATSRTTLASATGLTQGQVRPFEPPHTGNNYLLREMVHVVARKHATRLRIIGFALAIVLPAALLVTMPGVPTLLPLALHLAGVLVTRWLFFAEAEHVVGLYYGRPATP